MVAAVGLFFGGRYLINFRDYLNIIASIEISNPDFSRVHDGIFNGFVDANFISADVDVIVENHKIVEIILNEHNHDRGFSAEVIIDRVLVQQTLEVDTVSGATNSSLVILQAIQIALEGGMK